MSAELACVPPDQVHIAWPGVAGMVRAAMKRADLGSFELIRKAVLRGEALLWLAIESGEISACCVTQLAVTEWRKVCELVACGGSEMDRWLWMLGTIEKYAKAEGCDAVRITGRNGWARVLPDYRPFRVVLEKGL